MSNTTEELPVKPEPTDRCTSCGHEAQLHDQSGCHHETSGNLDPNCQCGIMVFNGIGWPRPHLDAPEGLSAG